MADCGFTVKNTCGERLFATCVYYEGVLPDFTTLDAASCYTLEEIVTDVYLQLTDIYDALEVDSLLGGLSLTYTLVDGKITVRQALKTFEEEIDSLKDKVDNAAKYQLCDLPIDGCALDLGALEDACGGTITNFGELFQALIDGGVGAGAVIVTFDLYNSSGGTQTVTFAQPGENNRVIPINSFETIVVSLNISKDITTTISGGISPTAEVIDSRYSSDTQINDITFNFTQSFVDNLTLGANSNPRIQIIDVA